MFSTLFQVEAFKTVAVSITVSSVLVFAADLDKYSEDLINAATKTKAVFKAYDHVTKKALSKLDENPIDAYKSLDHIVYDEYEFDNLTSEKLEEARAEIDAEIEQLNREYAELTKDEIKNVNMNDLAAEVDRISDSKLKIN